MRWPIILAALLVVSPYGAKAGNHRPRYAAPITGTASYYGWREHGHQMANGHRFDALRMTVASRTIPLGTRVRITNLRNHRHAIATVTDRGPFVGHRIMDVSLGVARKLGMEGMGLIPVSIECISNEG